MGVELTCRCCCVRPLVRSRADTAPPSLFLTTGELERQKSAGIFFLRAKGAKEVNDSKPDEDLTYATVPPRAMEGLQVMLSQLYLPLIETESKGWRAGVGVEDSTQEFFASYHKFGETLGEAVSSLQGGFTLRRPDNLFDIENKVPRCHSYLPPPLPLLLSLLPPPLSPPNYAAAATDARRLLLLLPLSPRRLLRCRPTSRAHAHIHTHTHIHTRTHTHAPPI